MYTYEEMVQKVGKTHSSWCCSLHTSVYLSGTKDYKHKQMHSKLLSPSLCLFVSLWVQDVQQQRHTVLMCVDGAVCMSRGVHVHCSVPRRRHLPQDGGLPEDPTAVRRHTDRRRQTHTCPQVRAQRDKRLRTNPRVAAIY